MVRIHVLDMPGAIHTDSGGQVHRMMFDAELTGSGGERAAASVAASVALSTQSAVTPARSRATRTDTCS